MLTGNAVRNYGLPASRKFLARNITTDVKTKPNTFPKPHFVHKNGVDLIYSPIFNKGTAFSVPERDRLNLRGLVPPREMPLEDQVARVMQRYRVAGDDLRKNSFLSSLQDRNETLFYKLLIDNIKEMAPVIYTPTVGKTCLQFGQLYRRARGMYFTSNDKGHMSSMVYNWPEDRVDVIVVTDGSRILGLGDLGAHGMAIPIGKLALYTAAGGIHPAYCLPITIDIGTNNPKLLADPLYLGLQQKRITGDEYFSLIDEFMHAVTSRWPHVLVQFEDFDSAVAFPLLRKYRNNFLCFNDDIQGTGAVALGGVLSAIKIKGKSLDQALESERIVCVGAGSAGLGVINGIMMGLISAGIPIDKAREMFWLVDRDGLFGRGREGMNPGQVLFARNETKYPDKMSLLDTIAKVKPTILLGLSGVGGIFSEPIIKEMAKHVDQPIIFPLSNPDTSAECTARQAYEWTEGRAIVATGSPFEPVMLNDKLHHPSQGNNMFIFPGVGLGALLCKAKIISDGMFYAAAKALANSLTPDDIKLGRVYPDTSGIRKVSRDVAVAVIKQAFEERLANIEPVADLVKFVESNMYVPKYVPLVYYNKYDN